jgi:archaellum biogenesis ATPase FlaH
VATTFDVNKLLISKIIQEQDVSYLADMPSYFIEPGDYREAFEYIRQYYVDHSTVPTTRVFLADCPKIVLTAVDEPWDDIIDRVNNKYVSGIVESELSNIRPMLGDSQRVKDIVKILGSIVSQVHTAIPNSRAVDVTTTGDERLARYQERRDNPGTLVGIPSGFPTIDKATQGFQKGQLITFTGLTKASKSVVAMLMAMSAQEQGYRVLYLTYEQMIDEQTNRLDAYRAGFNDNKLNSGNLSDDDMVALKKGVHLTESLPPLTIAEDCMTVTSVGAQCDIYEPDLVIIDGVYMMDDDLGEASGSPQALTNIVKGLKNMAMNREICIIAVTQSTPARTKGEVLNNDSMMGSRAFGQYSNVVLGIERIENQITLRKLKIIMSRSCSPVHTTLEFDFDTATFEEIEDFEDPDFVDKTSNAEGGQFGENY